MKSLKLIVLILIAFLFSCEDGEIILPESNGRPGQVLVIMAKNKWENQPGKTIKEFMLREVPALPQPENEFTLSQMPYDAFNSLVNRTKNILIANISKKVKKSRVEVRYDRWAKPQIIIMVSAKTDAEFVELYKKEGEIINEYVKKAERDRLIKVYTKEKDKTITNALLKNHNIELTVPGHYKLDTDSSNFVWISYETNKLTQALLIWDYEYKDTSDFNAEKLIAVRDSVTKRFVHGEKDGTFMTTQKMYPFEYSEFEIKGRYTVEMKGLWDLKNGFQGGPFVSFTTVDSVRNRIVTVDAFVYAGKQDKRNFIRQVGTILHTLDFPK